MPTTAEVTVGSTWPVMVLFGSVDDAMDLDQIVDLDLDVGLHFEFLNAERNGTLDHFTARQARRKLYFDKRTKEKIFEKDDLVLVHNSRYFNAQNREAKLK
ncbi:hypothetical protein M422DRAFT_250845 [Sphaerobolus stellatus SS14]|uniref:Unplaced genomic scaffold SPHSTscaffold_36, whole genome shotgun sequence n=1 Tax=Sphaerobolus stellatus (strain SS14) TaxID=990650 RepID=A0A0C9VEU5_SPHS4|nr:hypothetical protein M422DRAFT_250845 [Sphaerobolus stellatus SS14]